jgi:hypothetical protein
MFESLKQLWDRIVYNATNSDPESWLLILGMFVVWGIFAYFHFRDYYRNPEKYKDNDKFFPPY